MSKKINYTKYPIRVCRYLNGCAICDSSIDSGQEYYDGGYGRRAHVKCVDVEYVPPSPLNEMDRGL